MKITIYELLGMVKDGKAPKKIKWRDKIWTYNNKDQDYEINDTDLLGYGFCNHRTLDFINDEVEILEEEKKIPEKLPDIKFENGKFYLPINDKQMYILREVDKVFLYKINSIIDYFKSKGE